MDITSSSGGEAGPSLLPSKRRKEEEEVLHTQLAAFHIVLTLLISRPGPLPNLEAERLQKENDDLQKEKDIAEVDSLCSKLLFHSTNNPTEK